jgi:uncharacterized protein YqgQ
MRGKTLKSIYDIQQLLKQYGTIIYVGERLSDLELMEMEVQELYRSNLIDTKVFQSAILLLRHEIRLEREKAQQNKGKNS